MWELISQYGEVTFGPSHIFLLHLIFSPTISQPLLHMAFVCVSPMIANMAFLVVKVDPLLHFSLVEKVN